jgi:transcriptional regulator with XRE-family HTH domain
MSLGDKIKQARIAKGWSQEDLAKRVGVSQPAIKKIEAGQTKRSRYLTDVLRAVGIAQDQTHPPAARSIGAQSSEPGTSKRRRLALEKLFEEVLRRAASSSVLDLQAPEDREALAELLAGLATAPLSAETILDDEQALQSQVETAFHLLSRPELEQ